VLIAFTKMEEVTKNGQPLGRSLLLLVVACLLTHQSEAQVPLTKAQADTLYSQRLSSNWMKFVVPPNWSEFVPYFSIYENPVGDYFADVNEQTLIPVGYESFPIYYVDPISGADSKDGSRKDRAFRSIAKALSMSGNKRILCRPALYDYITGWKGSSSSGKVIVEPWDETGSVVSSGHIPNIVWTPLGGGLYTARCSTFPHEVLDEIQKDEWGNGVRYRRESDSDDVEEDAGTFYVSGKDIVVHTLDGRTPDSDLWIFTNQPNGRFNSNGELYVRNLEFRGGFVPFQCLTTVPGQIATFIDCTFRYSVTGQDGYSMEGPGLSIAIRCKSTGNYGDGFDYRYGRNFIEVDCNGSANGIGSSYLDNGTTAHYGSIGITIGGLYSQNKGRNIHDVFDSKRLLLGATVGASRGIDASRADICSGASTATSPDRTEIWALGIRYLHGSPVARSTASEGKIWYRRHVSSGTDTSEQRGTIRPI